MPLSYTVEDTPWRGRVKGYLLGWLGVGFMFPALLVCNLGQSASMLLAPFSRKAVRLINRGLANWWWGQCVHLARRFLKVEVRITGDDVPADEEAIVVCNHQSMSDIPVLFELAYRKGRLGDLKWYVKDILKYVPGIGWGMVFLDCLFVKRNWTEDKESIEATFRRIVRNKVPVWVVSFAEGTRITPAKAAASRGYAVAHGLPELEHVMLPRTKGFVATVEGLGHHLDAIYDVTIGYVHSIPTLWQFARGLAPEVNLHVQRFGVADLPQGGDRLATWLVERYAAKDRLLDEYYRTGAFPSAS